MTASIDYRMPKLAMAMNEGTINEWLVAHGDYVEAGTPIAVIETEKTAYDCEAPATGYLEILGAVEETVPVDTLIGRFHAEQPIAEQSVHTPEPTPKPTLAQSHSKLPQASSSPVAQTRPDGRIIASPAARKLARTEGVDLREVAATGPKGRIVKRDVQATLEQEKVASETVPLNQAPVAAEVIPIKGGDAPSLSE